MKKDNNVCKLSTMHKDNKITKDNNYMIIDVNWIDSSIQNYINLKQMINKDDNNPIMTQDYNAKIRILKEVKKQLKSIK